MRLEGELSNRVLFGLGYAAVLLISGWLGGLIFWAVLALAFGLCAQELMKLLPDDLPALILAALGGLGLTFLSLGVLRGWFGYFPALFGFFVSAFVFDTASYFGGRYFGGAKLVPTLSPGKTRSGLLCGLAATLVLAPFILLGPTVWAKFFFALLLCAAFLAGDLSISALKRQKGVKDTGEILPGHGGMLDRMDSLLIAGPLYWFLLWMAG